MLTAGVVLGVRLWGPGDLYEKDQPKTIAYTADIVLHGRYALPRDVIYQPATKPPMFNWIGALAVKITGRWDEWVLKLPSLLGSIGTGLIVYAMARRMHPTRPVVFGCLAAAIWFTFGSDVRHGSVIRLSYLARPDMLQCFFLTAGWACATLMLAPKSDDAEQCRQVGICRSVCGWTVLFWLCVTGAILTKGPAAVMVVIYAVAYSCLTTRRWRWLIGAIIPILLAGAWLAAAYQQDPDHVRQTILGAEVIDRVTEESPEGFSKPIYYSLMWFVTKALPWGLTALLGTVLFCTDRKRYAWLVPAAVWLGVVLLVLSIPAGKRMDYLIPAYAPASVMAAFAMCEIHWRWILRSKPASDRLVWLILLPLGLAITLAYLQLTRFHESKEHWTDRAVAFATQVRPIIGTDNTLVIIRGKHPIPTLIGRHYGSYLTPDDLAAAKWVILPEQPDFTPVVLSEPVPIGFETIEKRPLARLGLYRSGPSGVPLQTLIFLQKQLAEWKREENPYHAPNTVYRDK